MDAFCGIIMFLPFFLYFVLQNREEKNSGPSLPPEQYDPYGDDGEQLPIADDDYGPY